MSKEGYIQTKLKEVLLQQEVLRDDIEELKSINISSERKKFEKEVESVLKEQRRLTKEDLQNIFDEAWNNRFRDRFAELSKNLHYYTKSKMNIGLKSMKKLNTELIEELCKVRKDFSLVTNILLLRKIITPAELKELDVLLVKSKAFSDMVETTHNQFTPKVIMKHDKSIGKQ